MFKKPNMIAENKLELTELEIEIPINQISNEALKSIVELSESTLELGIFSIFDYFENSRK
jgi:hypothetical protein